MDESDDKKKLKRPIHRRRHPACVPCQKRKIRCVGEGTPCKTCIARQLETLCVFRLRKNVARDKTASGQILISRDSSEQSRIQNELKDTAGSPSTLSTVTSLSRLSQTPSMDLSDGEDDVDVNQTPQGLTSEGPLDVLPPWGMVDRLKELYFAFVFPLFCTFSSVQFEDEYRMYRQSPEKAPISWFSLLLAILALACRAEGNPEKFPLFDRLSIAYEKAAWDCLSLKNPSFETSMLALKALVLIIYGRIHRGVEVSSDLRMGYKMATSISCSQSTTYGESQTLWTALEMLAFMNGQLYDDSYEQEVARNLYVMAGIERREAFERHHGIVNSHLSVMSVTVLQPQILKISDIIFASRKHGLISSWSLAGVASELSRIENICDQLDAELCSHDPQSDIRRYSVILLRYNTQYLLQSAHFPYFESYLQGDTTPYTQSAAEQCFNSAAFVLKTFCDLGEDNNFKRYSWYLRGLGGRYAVSCMSTLTRGLEGTQAWRKAGEARYYLERGSNILSTSD